MGAETVAEWRGLGEGEGASHLLLNIRGMEWAQSRRVNRPPMNLTTLFIEGSTHRFNLAEPNLLSAMAMTNPTLPHKHHPSAWAVALLAASSAFALLAIALFSTGYGAI